MLTAAIILALTYVGLIFTSTATIVGNPQNMLIGVSSGISFNRFLMHLLPVALVSMLLLIVTVYVFYHRQMRVGLLVTTLTVAASVIILVTEFNTGFLR